MQKNSPVIDYDKTLRQLIIDKRNSILTEFNFIGDEEPS